MRDNGAGKRSDSKNKRQALAAVIAAFCLYTCSALSGCRSPIRSDPDAVIHEIQGDLARGELDVAEGKVSLARHSFPANCADCEEKLSLLEAEILTLQSKSKDVAALFCDGHPLNTTHVDSTIKEKMFCGLAHAHLGQQALSTREIEDAEQLAQGSGSSLEAEVLQTKGRILALRNQLADAQASFQASLTMARQQRDRQLEAGDLLDLGYLALQEERYGEALDWFNASSQIASSIQSRALLETDLGNVGWAYYKLGDYEVALDKFLEAEKQAERLGAQIWLENAGLCRQQLGDLPGAVNDYKTALTQAQRAGNKDDIADIHVLIALLDLQSGRLDDAEVHATLAQQASSASGYKSAQRDAMLVQGLIEERQGDDAAALPTLMNAYRESAKSPSIRWQIESTLAAISDRARHPQEAANWYRKSISTFEAQRTSVTSEELRLPFFANGDELYRDYADFLIRSHKPKQALGLLDLGRARTLAEGLGKQPETAAPSRATTHEVALNPQETARKQQAAILFYALGPEKSWLWAANAHGTRLFILPKKSEIEANVAAYLKAILHASDPLRDQNSQALALYNTLVAPAAAMVPPGSRVILIPDGALNQLNFETLLAPGKDGPHYWIEDVTITNANSIRMLSRSNVQDQNKREKTLLLMGDTLTNGTDFDKLQNAPAEVGAIEGEFPEKDRTVITQANAVPAAYAASKPGQFSYIHFVAHGTASRLSPLDSAVILSPSPEHPENYKLYARNIIHQPIHADLVTISACNGSGTRAYAGEGLVGLSWAFLRAGAHNVIGALWNVDDASAPQLMSQLYSGLRSGEAPDVAFRNAKLSLVHSDGIHRKPLYWAAFQLYAGS